MSDIFIVKYDTENADRGLLPFYLTVEPTEEQLFETFKNDMPDEFELDEHGNVVHKYLTWEVIRLPKLFLKDNE